MKLGQLILFSGDSARLAAFYRDVLGLAVLEDEPGWVVLDAGGVAMSPPRTYGPRTFSDGMDVDGNVFQVARHR
jgi:hypothetical protein